MRRGARNRPDVFGGGYQPVAAPVERLARPSVSPTPPARRSVTGPEFAELEGLREAARAAFYEWPGRVCVGLHGDTEVEMSEEAVAAVLRVLREGKR